MTITIVHPSVQLRAKLNKEGRDKLAKLGRSTIRLSTILRNLSKGVFTPKEFYQNDDLSTLLIADFAIVSAYYEVEQITYKANNCKNKAEFQAKILAALDQLKYWAHYSYDITYPIPPSISTIYNSTYKTQSEKAEDAYDVYCISQQGNWNLYESKRLYGQARLDACRYLSSRLVYKPDYDVIYSIDYVIAIFDLDYTKHTS